MSEMDSRLSWSSMPPGLKHKICTNYLFNFYTKKYIKIKLIKENWNDLIPIVQKILVKQGIKP